MIKIYTVTGNRNYGNKLQNYALVTLIGNDCQTVWNYNFKDAIKSKLIIKKEYKRFSNFYKFTKKYLNITTNKDINKDDIALVGSDQVWNYNFPVFKDNIFLDGYEYNKTIAYAPSFGVSEIPSNYIDTYKKGIANIKYLSCREKDGCDLIKKITGRDAKLVLDPTMLLTSSEWKKIEKMPKRINKKEYILLYILGDCNQKDKIKDLAKKNNLKIIDLMNPKDKYYTSGPMEFLSLIRNSKLIITDSFHACAFSIIYERPFFVVAREQEDMKPMIGRINTLLETFKLEKRLINDFSKIKDPFSIDYTKTSSILLSKREESKKFLIDSLNNIRCD